MQNYNELNELLITSGAGFHASECHGFLCALICGNGQIQEQKIKDYFLLDTEEIINPEDCLNYLKALAEDIQAKMYSLDFELELLLADENNSLEERSRSLAEWCQGFMSGMGLSGLKQEQIPPESQELISDFYKIASLDTECKDNSNQEDDFALMELAEYVRVGAIFIFEELQGGVNKTGSDKPEVLH